MTSTQQNLRVLHASDGPAQTAVPAFDPGLSVALVHDWLPFFRGGERVLAELARLFEKSDIYTLFDFLPDDVRRDHFSSSTFHTSIANKLPRVKTYYRSLFFACPFLIEQFDVTGHDIVISSSAAFARGVITRPDQPHLCYVHSPIRYAWDEQFNYLEQGNLRFGPKGLLFRYLLHKIRTWDARTAHGPDLMIANSNYVRQRIKRIYGRDADVIFPPISDHELTFVADKDDYYVTASFLAPYKRTDLVIKAFNAMPHRRLVVVGEGQQSKSLRSIAGANVEFTGFLARDAYVRTVSQARAFVFAGCEDFGIALAEAQAWGTPLIAFGRGGAKDIVQPLGQSSLPTGVLFARQTVDALIDAVDQFEGNSDKLKPEFCYRNALRFSRDRFAAEMGAALGKVMEIAK